MVVAYLPPRARPGFSLHIEGWPICRYGEGSRDLEAQRGRKVAKLIIDTLWDLCPHMEIWAREKRYGFSQFQKQLTHSHIENFVIPNLPNLWHGWSRHWDLHQKMGTVPVQVLDVIPVLLAPASKAMRERVQKSLKTHLALKAYQQVDAICQVFLERRQSFPQSTLAVFEEVANKLRLPPKLLEPSYLSKIYTDFFGGVQRVFREN